MKKKRHTRGKKITILLFSLFFVIQSVSILFSFPLSLSLRVEKIAYTASIWNHILCIGFARVFCMLFYLFIWFLTRLGDFCARVQFFHIKKEKSTKILVDFLSCDFLRYLSLQMSVRFIEFRYCSLLGSQEMNNTYRMWNQTKII